MIVKGEKKEVVLAYAYRVRPVSKVDVCQYVSFVKHEYEHLWIGLDMEPRSVRSDSTESVGVEVVEHPKLRVWIDHDGGFSISQR